MATVLVLHQSFVETSCNGIGAERPDYQQCTPYKLLGEWFAAAISILVARNHTIQDDANGRRKVLQRVGGVLEEERD